MAIDIFQLLQSQKTKVSNDYPRERKIIKAPSTTQFCRQKKKKKISRVARRITALRKFAWTSASPLDLIDRCVVVE